MADLERLSRLLDAAQAHHGQVARPTLAPEVAPATPAELAQVQATLAHLAHAPVDPQWLAQVLVPRDPATVSAAGLQIQADFQAPTGLKAMWRTAWRALRRQPPVLHEPAFARWDRWCTWSLGAKWANLGLLVMLNELWLIPASHRALKAMADQADRLLALPTDVAHAAERTAGLQQIMPVFHQALHEAHALVYTQWAVMGISLLSLVAASLVFYPTLLFKNCSERHLRRAQARWATSPTVQAYLADRPDLPFRNLEVDHLDRLAQADARAIPATKKPGWFRPR